MMKRMKNRSEGEQVFLLRDPPKSQEKTIYHPLSNGCPCYKKRNDFNHHQLNRPLLSKLQKEPYTTFCGFENPIQFDRGDCYPRRQAQSELDIPGIRISQVEASHKKTFNLSASQMGSMALSIEEDSNAIRRFYPASFNPS